jgi:hypothetical protein
MIICGRGDDWKKNICVWFMNVVSLVEYGYLKNDEDNGFVIADIPTASASPSAKSPAPIPRVLCLWLKQHVKMRKNVKSLLIAPRGVSEWTGRKGIRNVWKCREA